MGLIMTILVSPIKFFYFNLQHLLVNASRSRWRIHPHHKYASVFLLLVYSYVLLNIHRGDGKMNSNVYTIDQNPECKNLLNLIILNYA